MGRIIWWYPTLLLMYRWCRTLCLNVSLSNCNKYFYTAFDLILAKADDFNFSPVATYRHAYLRIGSFLSSSAMSSGITWMRTDTKFNKPSISSASSSSTIDCTAQLIESATFFRSLGILVVSWYESTNSQTDEYEMTSTSSLSESLSISKSLLCGCLLKASVALLDLPVH